MTDQPTPRDEHETEQPGGEHDPAAEQEAEEKMLLREQVGGEHDSGAAQEAEEKMLLRQRPNK
jgi:hypothetical protein